MYRGGVHEDTTSNFFASILILCSQNKTEKADSLEGSLRRFLSIAEIILGYYSN
jgi:hypothetical protein